MEKLKMWVVKPDSVKLGLSNKNEVVAAFVYKVHASKWGRQMWGDFYVVEKREISIKHTLS